MLAVISEWADSFDGKAAGNWMNNHVEIPVLAVLAYLYMVLYIPKSFMKNREPYHLKRLNTIWDLGLTLFSIIGAYHTLPGLYTMLFADSYEVHTIRGTTFIVNGGWYNTLCVWHHETAMDGKVGFAMFLFTLSKIPEMLDTAFLVFQKKRIIFLHWYHHITVMLFCWHGFIHKTPPGLIFCGMNYGVHSIMYFYYFMCSLGYRPYIRRFAPLITLVQIIQMVVGTLIEISSLYYMYGSKRDCENTSSNVYSGFLMYLSYFYLFSVMFKANYLTKKERRGGEIRPVAAAPVDEVATAGTVDNGKKSK